ncbi:uncharacterized protein K460DRAFT_370502 [Cucurbitaria berberidis CBS 394.84]|uniref:Cyclin-like domain-containing protein n=1 Tax=Cucurbitaria berberidis CBS 394.84 TaxID=1168544 RepID=A0A9P4GB39_9PLEO|nr:uncharacterized protein K460DRAFT_370502 [Cucurbitaria berberidis CBS 394.84]KAF1842538.1 hypothetical protein K460DRAFT_370502 [Cucurbitaria berberidis CBS 394.84]
MSAPTVARPRAPRIGGLSSSKKPDPYQSITTKRNALPAPPPPKPVDRAKCCDSPDVHSEDNLTLCYSCGKVFEESSIVAEVTFGETAGGAAIVEGGFIGENQRHANSMGGTMRGLGGMESREQAAMHGRHAIEALAHSLQVRQSVIDQAVGWYKLAMNHNFIQGRRMRNVAAVAIYMAARRQPENTLMLMDLAEKIQTNVWALGDTYKAFLKKLGEEDPAQLVGNKAVQEIEPLMLKYCRKLEFYQDSHKVADDACKLLKRMSRDWMVQGRQPAGLCGACIIIAARMNNFRRTVREVVYVVKVADSTINSRLYEFKRTPTSALSVDQFRQIGQRLKVTTQPPAIWRRAEKEERKEKRKNAQENVRADDGTEVAPAEQSGNSGPDAGPSSSSTRASKRRKSNSEASQAVATQSHDSDTQDNDPPVPDADALDGNNDNVVDSVGSALAEVEAGEASDPDFTMPKKRGRPKQRDPIVIPPEDLEIEQDIESELTHVIKDWEGIFKEFANNENHELLKRTGWTAQEMTRAHTDSRDVPVNLSPDIGEDEFDDDPDVANCILGPDEVRRKEAIWITENEDWLRTQQKKMLEAELEAAEDKPKKPKQKRRHHQMGDGSLLDGQPAASAAEAAHKMLKKRANGFSHGINYEKLKELFPGGDTASSPSDSGQGASASPAASQVTRAPPIVQVTNAHAEGEEEENEDMQDAASEDDLEHQYMEDEDEGFGEDYEYE